VGEDRRPAPNTAKNSMRQDEAKRFRSADRAISAYSGFSRLVLERIDSSPCSALAAIFAHALS